MRIWIERTGRFGVWALAAAGAVAVDAPEFARGELSELEAKVGSAEPVVKGEAGTIVEIEVTNRGDLHAEPLVFRLTPRARRGAPEPVELARVEHPHHGRSGRAVAPGEERTYPLLVPYEAEVAERCEIEVLSASFADGAVALDEPVAIGPLRRGKEFRDLHQKTVEVTRVELENRTAWPLDAVLRAEYHEPKRGVSLVRYRLEAGETREVALDQLSLGGGSYWPGAEVVRLELADVSAVVDDGVEIAAELFREAWDAWRSLPDGAPALGARYELTQRTNQGPVESSGELVLRPGGGFEVAPDDPGDDVGAGATRSALREVLELVRRPTADAVLAAERPTLVAWGETSVVRFETAPFQGGQRWLHLWIRGGRIVGESLAPERMSTPWTLRDEGSGYVVLAKEQPVDWQRAPQDATRVGYARVGEWLLPVSYSDEMVLESIPSGGSRTRLSISGWTPGVDPDGLGTGAPPEGELADLLRAAWELPYRYPDEPAVLRGRFELTSPANDALWQGHRKVAGSFELRGFRGTRWGAWEIDVEGDELGDEERRQLASVVEDRFRMFAGRDFGGRPPFERAFRRARLEREGDAILVRGAGVVAGIERVELSDERPVALVLSGGARREIVWKRRRSDLLPVRVTTGDEVIRYEWTDLGHGWRWPKEVVMEDVFPDWGPEKTRFSKLELQRE